MRVALFVAQLFSSLAHVLVAFICCLMLYAHHSDAVSLFIQPTARTSAA
jgi:hypothetical protein